MTKILIIEDDPAIQTGLQDLLQYENYEILSCMDGKKGIETALSTSPDLVILDINLPGLNGFEVCRMLREKNFHNPIIMLTSRGENIDRIVGLEIGANDYVTKPFDSRELLARIHSQLRNIERISTKAVADINSLIDKNTRRLLAVMFTDIKDYSKKMNTNEKLALKSLEVHNGFIKEVVLKHGGDIIENIGDAFVIIFESAVKSVECAYDIQQKFKVYNETKNYDEQIELRLGIHLGDVIHYTDNIKGDTVNIAARIQQNSLSGNVTISDSIYIAVKNKVDFQFKYLGEFNFKNISGPVKLYSIVK